MRVLVVTNPFGGRGAGERITDQGEIDAILAGEHAHHVVRADHADGAAAAPAAPAPLPTPKPSDDADAPKAPATK